MDERAWDNISCVHSVLIFNEAKPIHELDLLDRAGAMSAKVFLDFRFCDWKGENKSQRLATFRDM